MKTLLYMFLIIPYVVFSQNFEKIKKSDTIYIFFKKDNGKQFHNLETPAAQSLPTLR